MLSFSDAFTAAAGPGAIYLFTAPTDMRKSFDGLCGLIESFGGAKCVTDGGLFVFINRRRDRMKLMYFDQDGLAIWYKRLEQGRFELPAIAKKASKSSDSTNPAGRGDVMISARQLRLILDGIDLSSVRQRKRFTPKPPTTAPGCAPAPGNITDVTDDDRTAHRTTQAT